MLHSIHNAVFSIQGFAVVMGLWLIALATTAVTQGYYYYTVRMPREIARKANEIAEEISEERTETKVRIRWELYKRLGYSENARGLHNPNAIGGFQELSASGAAAGDWSDNLTTPDFIYQAERAAGVDEGTLS